AANNRTGTFTSPKDTAPFQIALMPKLLICGADVRSTGSMSVCDRCSPPRELNPLANNGATKSSGMASALLLTLLIPD
ncbi:MAG: hypothetical protein ABI418_07030, partial [Jatrophihabitantaceae bacterium]